MMWPNAIVCVNECVTKLLAVWKLQIWPVTDLCKSPVNYWWPTDSCFSSCELLKQHYLIKPVYVSINVSIYLKLYPVSYCAIIAMNHKLLPTLYRQPLNKAWVQAGGCKQSLPRYSQGQSRTCYQECMWQKMVWEQDYWWPTASYCSSRESRELLKQHSFLTKSVCVSINLSIYWTLSI